MSLSRRDFIAAAAGSVLLAPRAGASIGSLASTADSVIFLMLTGGPSQLDTWDPKPDAPSGVRSPFASIPTKVPGVRVTELFPKMAGIADKFALVRSLHHTDAPVHEVGFQWVNSGRFFGEGPEWPGVGAVTAKRLGEKRTGVPASFVPRDRTLDTGLDGISHGQGHGFLRSHFAPCGLDRVPGVTSPYEHHKPESKYGWNRVGCSVSLAVRLIDLGVRHVTMNLYDSVFNRPTWDCHAQYGTALACTLGDVRETVAPFFDVAFTQLVTDLDQRGLLERTLVVATGEFGRTPKFNCNGGRDHWPGVWTTILAGGGVKGGQVIGSSDAIASEPKDRPVHASDIPATIFHALGIGPDATIPGPNGATVPAYTGRPVVELF